MYSLIQTSGTDIKISSTVRELLQKKIHGSCSQAQFRSDVMKPLKIEELMDRQVANLSGWEGVTKGCTLSLSRKGKSTLNYSPYILSLRFAGTEVLFGLPPGTFGKHYES